MRGDHLTTSYDANLLAAPIDPHLGIRNWGATAENPTGLRYFRDPLLFQDNVYESGAESLVYGRDHGGEVPVPEAAIDGCDVHVQQGDRRDYRL